MTLVRGIYTAANGAIVAQSNVDIIANNLANVNTSGFKRTLMQIESQPKVALYRDQIDPGTSGGNRTPGVATHTSVGDLGFGSRIYDTPTVFEQGPIQQTGNSMDVALNGPGFFAVRDAAGNVRYTRGGSFTQNAQNQLVTTDGEAVLGTNGQPVSLQQGNVNVDLQGNITTNGTPTGQLAVVAIKIDPRGGVSANGIPTGQLGVFEFANLTNLRSEGADKFVNAGAAPQNATRTTVLQGAQEKSNANVISSMVGLITNERWFDANQKMIQTQDTELGAAISTVGKSTQ
jgi:flagellar basal-body rod protein FlgF